jgi:hypothetical protein
MPAYTMFKPGDKAASGHGRMAVNIGDERHFEHPFMKEYVETSLRFNPYCNGKAYIVQAGCKILFILITSFLRISSWEFTLNHGAPAVFDM